MSDNNNNNTKAEKLNSKKKDQTEEHSGMSPVMNSLDEIAGYSPEGSPTAYYQKRKAQEEKRQREFETGTPKNRDEQHEVSNSSSAFLPTNESQKKDSINENNDNNDNEKKKKPTSSPTSTTTPNGAARTRGPGGGAAAFPTKSVEDITTHFGSPNYSGQIESTGETMDNFNGNNTNINMTAPLLNADGALLHPHLKKVTATSTDVFESLNYDEVENIPLQEERIRRGGDLDPSMWKMWIILALCGICTGLVAYGIDKGQSALSKVKFDAVEHFLLRDNVSSSSSSPSTNPNVTTTTGSSLFSTLDASSSSSSSNSLYFDEDSQSTHNLVLGSSLSNHDPGHIAAAILIFIGINLAYAAIASAIVVLGEPMAKGSGIPEVKCYLNGVRIWRVVRLKTMLVKASGILFAVASGLPVGKEGPMIHSGSAIASGISTGKSSLLKWDTGFFREFRSDAYKRAFITAGAAAGVGAAFGAPIGGIIFAIEEVGSFWNLELTVMVFVAAAVAPWTLQVLMHPDGLESGKVSGLIDFGLVTGSYSYVDVPFLIILGVLCGGLGAIFIWMNCWITQWRKRNVTTKIRKFSEVMIISLTVSIVLILLVVYGYRCVKIDGANENTLAQMKQFGCSENEFNDMATYFFVELEKSINLLIHEERPIHLGTLAKQFFPMFFLTIVTYGINVPSGLFLPSLALGANFGHMFSQLMNLMIPALKLNNAHFALYGGTAILAGNLRMTISVVAIVMEATGNATLFYPLAIVTICAKFFGDIFNHGIFDEHIDLAKIPLLMNKNPQPEMAVMDAEDIMNKIPIRLPSRCTLRVLVHVLKHYSFHNTYAVADEETGRFRGLLLRRTALILVDKEAWKNILYHDDFEKTEKERKYVSVKKYGVLERPMEEDMDCEVDLLRYADLWPHVFHTSTPVPRVYRTFRELGLRHIVIVDDYHRPVGIIGRRQLCFLEIKDKEQAKLRRESSFAGDGLKKSNYGSNNNNNNNYTVNGSSDDSMQEKAPLSSNKKNKENDNTAYGTEYDDDDDEAPEFNVTGALPVEDFYVPTTGKKNSKNSGGAGAAASGSFSGRRAAETRQSMNLRGSMGGIEADEEFNEYRRNRSRGNSMRVSRNNNNNSGNFDRTLGGSSGNNNVVQNVSGGNDESLMLPLRDDDVRRSRLEKAPWVDTSVPEN